MRTAIRLTVAMVLVGSAGSAVAGRKTLVVGVGDCRDRVLLGSVKDFQGLARVLLRSELFEHDDVISRVRPQPTHNLDDLQRQVATAHSFLMNGQNDRAIELLNDALAGLERASPEVGPWPATANALVLQAQIYRNLDRSKYSREALRRILRVDPTYRADPNVWPPSTIRALDAVRKELQGVEKGLLRVSSLDGSGTSVYVDGREMGKTPLRLELPQGAYRVSLLSQNAESFPRVVNLGREAIVQVDMAFEGGLTAQVPLCLSGGDAGAIKLATVVGASRAVVVRNTAPKGYPPYVSGVLYEVDQGERVRSAGVRPEQLWDLVMYLFTGKPDIPKEPPPMAESPAQPELPPSILVQKPETRGFPLRPVGYTALAVGAAAATSGVIVFLLAPTIQQEANGNVLSEDVAKVRSTQRQQGVGVGLMVGGAAMAALGATALLLAHIYDETMRVAAAPASGGAVVLLGGQFQ